LPASCRVADLAGGARRLGSDADAGVGRRRRARRATRAASAGPGSRAHFVQTLEATELVEFNPREEHDRTMAAIAANMGLAV
jgi:hypothetical protein